MFQQHISPTQHPVAFTPPDQDDTPTAWRRAATTLGPLTLRVTYHATSGDAAFELISNHPPGTRLLEGTGNLADGIQTFLEAATGTINLHLSLSDGHEPRYTYELTSTTRGQLRCTEGTLTHQ